MANLRDYLESIAITAIKAQEALDKGDQEELIDLLGGIQDDLTSAEKLALAGNSAD